MAEYLKLELNGARVPMKRIRRLVVLALANILRVPVRIPDDYWIKGSEPLANLCQSGGRSLSPNRTPAAATE
jgi:hypothetical protein